MVRAVSVICEGEATEPQRIRAESRTICKAVSRNVRSRAFAEQRSGATRRRTCCGQGHNIKRNRDN